jgi:hypothetical protein
MPSLSNEIGEEIARADPNGDQTFEVVPAAVLFDGTACNEFVGKAKVELYALVKTDARTGSDPDLIPLTFIQFPVSPILSELPATPFIEVECVPDMDS